MRFLIISYPIAFATAFGPAYPSRPNGSASEIRSTLAMIFARADFISAHDTKLFRFITNL